jgi:hypothetical protein
MIYYNYWPKLGNVELLYKYIGLAQKNVSTTHTLP